MKTKQFSEEEIPYQTLSEFGLTHEMLDDLPMSVHDDITYGWVTPVLPIKMTAKDGHAVQSKARFSLDRTDNAVEVIFYPVLEYAHIEKFTGEQQALLKEGKAIMAELEKDGDTVMSFVQIDSATNQVMSVPSPVIGRNLQVLADTANLSSAEMNVIQNGDPLTIFVNDAPVTIGIHLLASKTGICIKDGDAQQWKESTKREWDKYTFGVNGCWISDDDGSLSYVPEEDYTDELWNELKKRTNQQNIVKR